MNIARLWRGLLIDGPSLPGGPESYFANISHNTYVAKSVLYNLQTLILDGVVVSLFSVVLYKSCHFDLPDRFIEHMSFGGNGMLLLFRS